MRFDDSAVWSHAVLLGCSGLDFEADMGVGGILESELGSDHFAERSCKSGGREGEREREVEKGRGGERGR